MSIEYWFSVTGFNSILVRLKVFRIGKWGENLKRFNSILVRLKAFKLLENYDYPSTHLSFNSILVRLKGNTVPQKSQNL